MLACAEEVSFYEAAGRFGKVSPTAFLPDDPRAHIPMHWYTAILLPVGLVCGLRLRLLAFVLLLIIPIVVTIAACDHWNRATYSQLALDMVITAVVLQIGYVLGVLGQIVFRHLSPHEVSSSSEKQ